MEAYRAKRGLMSTIGRRRERRLRGVLDARIDRGDTARTRNRTLSSNMYSSSESAGRAQGDDDTRELAGTTGLLLVRVLVSTFFADGLAVGNHQVTPLASTLNSRHTVDDSIEWSSPIPPMMVWPVSASSSTVNVRSSSARLLDGDAHLSGRPSARLDGDLDGTQGQGRSSARGRSACRSRTRCRRSWCPSGRSPRRCNRRHLNGVLLVRCMEDRHRCAPSCRG